MRLMIWVALLAAASLSGCASYTGQKLYKSPEEVPNYQKKEGFLLSAQIPKDAAYAVEMHGADLLSQNVLPLEIYMKNFSDTTDFHIAVANISFELLDGSKLNRLSPQDVQDRVGFSQWRSLLLYPLAVVPGIWSSYTIANANSAMLSDYRRKNLEDAALHAGGEKSREGLNGVIFFDIPSGSDLEVIREGILTAKVTKLDGAGRETGTVSMNISFQ